MKIIENKKDTITVIVCLLFICLYFAGTIFAGSLLKTEESIPVSTAQPIVQTITDTTAPVLGADNLLPTSKPSTNAQSQQTNSGDDDNDD